MNIAMFCCHVRTEMRVNHVMLPNALQWLLVGMRPEHETLCYFPCQMIACNTNSALQNAIKEPITHQNERTAPAANQVPVIAGCSHFTTRFPRQSSFTLQPRMRCSVLFWGIIAISRRRKYKCCACQKKQSYLDNGANSVFISHTTIFDT